MPKNKISGKYLENLKIFRGPTHDIPHLPQFAPDKNIYEYLPEANLEEYIRMNTEVKLFKESTPGLAKCNFFLILEKYGRDFEYFKTAEES